ncbi:phenylacetic acid degradation operon negative regulatory protein PaaX [Cupriavidus neocaledonicus]|uniref:Phenylacetic acid degradation operon negative regulatory protein n=1 Tax=Cupriavidus neocaledonicus TaxID=1040979 RepID=A0A375HML0_9BURK|nr:phenylacetic acid degradation operon negative regulatory protein PaaX [Cupriavidus neocaledonicus]SOZ38889.1 Phenylacetic acid degradation operon negative regulatory protein [Cupriavidus neocaledonicus]SPD59469.1 Phenylacetic acid degradation operon negative regulatory protein [Cupriavidus neocaledonicus]
MATSRDSELPSARITRLARGLKLGANSLLVTLYGDVVAPRPQAVWLGSLIRLAAPFGINDRLVRTATFRLTADDWLSATRIGRRSYYGLSEAGLQRVLHAGRRIYAGEAAEWDGRWTLVMVRGDVRATVRQKLKRELLWEGFGAIAPGVMAHPSADLGSLREIIGAARAQDYVAVMEASSLEAFSIRPLQALMHQTFKLGDVADAWQALLRRFSPLADEAAELAPADAFFVRTLLVHEYRRVLLRDPNLPEALLPQDWPGRTARGMCSAMYGALLEASEAYLHRVVEVAEGGLADAKPALRKRFTHA